MRNLKQPSFVSSGLAFATALAALVPATGHASKARLTALQFADFWSDPQNVFYYPQYANDLGSYATLEFGPTGTFSTGVHAEGGFARKFSESSAGLYLGHQSTALNTAYLAGAVAEQANPFYLYYARGNMGFGLNLSYSDVKSTGNKEMSLGGTFGMKAAGMDFGAVVTFYSKSENATTNTKVVPGIELYANRSAGDVKFYGAGTVVRTDAPAGSESNYSLKLGVQDHAYKIAGGSFFYGTQIGYAKTSPTVKGFNLPIYAGLEADLFSWAAIRGAISQSLIGYVDTGTKDLNTNNTVATLGGTVKTGGFQLDGLLAAAATGNLNGTSFLTTTSLTYHF